MIAWYKEWFSSEEYLIAYSHRNESDAKKINSLILKKPNSLPVVEFSMLLVVPEGIQFFSLSRDILFQDSI